MILFTATNGAPLSRVWATGGMPSTVTSLDTKAGETGHSFPFFLPDGRHFFYLARTGLRARGVYIGSLDSIDRKALFEGTADVRPPQYAQGHLVFLRGTTLMAQPFDAARLALEGEPVTLAQQIDVNPTGPPGGAFAVSQTGILVYQGATVNYSRLVWLDRGGKVVDVLGDPGLFDNVSLSRDGSRVLVSVSEPGTSADIWEVDVVRRLRSRVTVDPTSEPNALWSPDASRIVFNSYRNGRFNLYQKLSNGTGTEDTLLTNSLDKYPLSWSSDGRFVLYTAFGPKTLFDVWILPLLENAKPFPFLETPFSETVGQFSPDGRWVAYVSNESGRAEVYVTSFPGPVGKSRVSTAGGTLPRWRPDGKEIFYFSPDQKLMSARVTVNGQRFNVELARPLFGVSPPNLIRYFYDVAPDGQRFLMNKVEGQTAPQPITLVINWPASLGK